MSWNQEIWYVEMVRLRADGIKHQIVLMFSVEKEMMSSAENEVALEYDEG